MFVDELEMYLKSTFDEKCNEEAKATAIKNNTFCTMLIKNCESSLALSPFATNKRVYIKTYEHM